MGKSKRKKPPHDYKNLMYHAYIKWISGGLAYAIKKASTPVTIENYKLKLPMARILPTVICFIIFYRIGIPKTYITNGHVDYTIWTAVFGAEFAITLGLMAMSQTMAESLIILFGNFLAETAQVGLLPVSAVENETGPLLINVETELRQATNKMSTDMKATREIGVNLIKSGIWMLLSDLLGICTVFWTTPDVQIGILAASIIWLVTGHDGITMLLTLSSRQLALTSFTSIRAHHDQTPCRYCKKAEATSADSPTNTAQDPIRT